MKLLGAWLPLVFFVLGLIVFLVCGSWAQRKSADGYLRGFFEGLLAIAGCLMCWAVAGGLLVGRWLA